jgi:DNA (cytosine-5)-methyltransferase 1
MRLLDLFCCAGGAGAGYARAGFEVVGVDIEPQPRYPFEFMQGDAITYLREHGHEFDAVHASPPCQAYSNATEALRNAGKVYADLLAPTRDALKASGLPSVIENVKGAPMRPDLRLCGCQVGLKLRRERWFELSWPITVMLPPHHHTGPVTSVVGHGTTSWVREKLGYNPSHAQNGEAMGIDWMTRNELSEAIPPAYTELIGRHLLEHLARCAA